MAVYNSERTITRALESLIRQSRPADEIIAVDDGSTDGTAEIIKRFAGVKYLFQQNKGPAVARNNGVKIARGEYVSFLDSDDYWEPGHLKNVESILKENPGFKWASTGYRKKMLNGKSRIISLDSRYYYPGNRVDYFSATPNLHFLSVISTTIRRDFFLSSGGFAERFFRGEDLSLWLRLALQEPILGYQPEPTAVYVASPKSLTTEKRNLSELADRIICDWGSVNKYPSEIREKAWSVVRPWVSGLLAKCVRSKDRSTLIKISEVFFDRLTLCQKTVIRLRLSRKKL
ncbi:MAG TPA: glycosyltransferase family A protein [Bacteroidales bacterium]|nr:glycosyltransferase family A protein [Bacteroidales bacterium]HQG78677.1 glycosyltransferase family A protein [Bacteroidales bacterium]HQK71448.1 glycosyltransferase family A protein [Bacteroidales bacterium]